MHLFWDSFVGPILEITGPTHHIVEVGSSSGVNTKNILRYCKNFGSRCTVIDPLEIGNIDEIRQDLQRFGTQVKGLSLDTLEQCEPGTCYLIDGDHNYYTVINECRKILLISQKKNRKFPIVFFHDVEWPYARRDLYYNKSTIPATEALPSSTGGLFPGKSEQDPDAGLNMGLENALVEGGPKNGVLTAIEDFIEENKTVHQFKLYKVPSFHGLGVLIAQESYDSATLEKIEKILVLDPRLTSYLQTLESFRLNDLIHLLSEQSKLVNMYGSLFQEIQKERGKNDELRSELETAQNELKKTFYMRVRGFLQSRMA